MPDSTIELYSQREEQNLLGALLVNPGQFRELHLEPKDFFIHRHQWIYAAMGDVFQNNGTFDLSTVLNQLDKMGHLEDVDPAYLTSLSLECNSLMAGEYTRTVKTWSAKRRVRDLATEIAKANMTTPGEIPDLSEYLKQLGDIQSAKRVRYEIRGADYALGDLPPVNWLVNGMISDNSVNLFYGEAGSKKTYSMLSLAVCVAVGKGWLSFATRACPVLFVDEETGQTKLPLRLAAVLRGELCDASTPIYYVSLAGFMLDITADQQELARLILQIGAGLVILDNLSAIMTGDENSKEFCQPVLTALRRIADHTGSAIVVIHHSGKQGNYRGSSAIKGAVDLMVKVESEDCSEIVRFTSEKNRDGGPLKFAAIATWTPDQFYLTPIEVKPKNKPLSKSQEYVLKYLEEHGPSSLPAIKGAADSTSPIGARNAVYDLVYLEKIYRTNPDEKGRGTEAIYAIKKGTPSL